MAQAWVVMQIEQSLVADDGVQGVRDGGVEVSGDQAVGVIDHLSFLIDLMRLWGVANLGP